MEGQLYAAGQIVGVTSCSLSGPRTGDRFRIVRGYLSENRKPMYHIRSVRGREQRFVPEDELSATSSVFDRVSHSTKILRLFPQVIRFDRAARPS